MKIKQPFKSSLKFKLSLEWPVDRDPSINISATHSKGDKGTQTGPRSLDTSNAHECTTGRWCRWRKCCRDRQSDLPPPGGLMVNHTFNGRRPIVDQRRPKSLRESWGESGEVEVDPDSRGKLNSRSFIREKPKIQAKLLKTGEHSNLAILHYIRPSFMVCETLLWGKIWPCGWDVSPLLWCKLSTDVSRGEKSGFEMLFTCT